MSARIKGIAINISRGGKRQHKRYSYPLPSICIRKFAGKFGVIQIAPDQLRKIARKKNQLGYGNVQVD